MPKQDKGDRPSKLGRLMRFVGISKDVPLSMDDLSDEQIIIALMGPTGAGKSSFIAAATGFNTGIGHGLESRTTGIKIVNHKSPYRSDFDIVFVDTPGYDCPEQTEDEVLKMITDWVNKTYKRKVTLAGILYFHRISDNRATVRPLKNLRKFRELCGENSLQNIILTTTMWDDVGTEEGDGREAELRSRDWKGMLDMGSTTPRFHRTPESAWSVLDGFVRDANARHASLLRKELTDLKKQLPGTTTANRLCKELEVLIQKRQATLQKIRGTTTPQDTAIVEALKAEHDNIRKQLVTVLNDLQKMKLPIGKHILNLRLI